MSKIFRAEASTYGLSAAPYNTAIPTFSGTSRIGNIQTGSAGTWINTPTSYSYRWYRASTSTGTYSAISGATSLSYTPITADSNQFLKLEVTATNAQGSTVETSTATQMIQGVPNLSLSSGLPVATYRTVRNLTLTPGSLGKVTFFNNDKRIAGCIGLVASAANSYSVTCPWKASKIGTNTVKASFTSDDAGYVGGTTTITSITIQRRSTAR
jgi:hypothetical protein